MKEHVLVILPHPDDESYGVAGLIALHRQKNIPVTYACATLGEMDGTWEIPFSRTVKHCRC